MKNMCRRFVILVCVALMLVSVLTGCGKNEDKTLSIKVKQVEQTRDALQILFATENNAGNEVSLGWVNSCRIEVTTTEDTYYYKPHMKRISIGDDETAIKILGAEGEVQRIVITELCLLNDDGLPGKEIHNAVVFDEKKGIDGFEDSFPAFVFSFPNVMSIIMPILMIGILIFCVFWMIHTHKQNREAVQNFNPFGAPSGADFNPAHDTAHQMHMDAHRMHMNAHQMHVDAHQNFVNQNTMQNHMEFTQAASMPMDMGGFLPPNGF